GGGGGHQNSRTRFASPKFGYAGPRPGKARTPSWPRSTFVFGLSGQGAPAASCGMCSGGCRERHVQCGFRAADAAPPRTRISAAPRETLAAARDVKLVLRMADALLELPAVGARLAALDPLELGLRLLELGTRAGIVALDRAHGLVDERDRSVELDLEEAGARGVLAHLFAGVDARGAGLQRRDERRVPREDADLSGRARHDDHLRVALERRPLRRHQRDVEASSRQPPPPPPRTLRP